MNNAQGSNGAGGGGSHSFYGSSNYKQEGAKFGAGIHPMMHPHGPPQSYGNSPFPNMSSQRHTP